MDGVRSVEVAADEGRRSRGTGARIERLQWDSDFFDVEIGRVEVADWQGEVDPVEMLGEVDREARDQGLECLYLTVDAAHGDVTMVVQEAGYRLVEVAMDLAIQQSVIAVPSESEATVRVGGPDDMERLESHLDLLAPWSRYAVDPRFGPEAARRMYSAWIERAAGPDPDRHLWVAEQNAEIVGFATGSTIPGELPRIDLIVSTRPGVGRRIVEVAYEGFGDGPSMGGPIAVRNGASLRFVLGLGHKVSTARYIFHRWLTD